MTYVDEKGAGGCAPEAQVMAVEPSSSRLAKKAERAWAAALLARALVGPLLYAVSPAVPSSSGMSVSNSWTILPLGSYSLTQATRWGTR